LARAQARDTLRRRLVGLLAELPAAQAVLERAITEANTPDALDALHAAQAWRLAYWRVASDEINYRRFFDINELAALRMEEPAVFEATHGFALDLAAAGVVDGLRIDHPDGLHDPAAYFDRVQHGYARRAGRPAPLAREGERPARPLYVVAEKIAAAHEDVPEDWAVHGTTGYRFANVVNGVLVDTEARDAFERLWRHASDGAPAFDELAIEGKHLVMRSTLAAGLTSLATELLRIARAHRLTRDFTWNVLREALAEVTACLPVYRTYLVTQPSAQDVRYVDWAVAQARRRARMADASAFDFLRETLLARPVEGADAALAASVHRFALRFQQFSAPVAAKGVEDTAFYRHQRLVSLNEVGGDPGTFGLTLRGFHGANLDRAERWPASLVATSTHDNKRGEDVRCRLDVLTEMPGAWRLALRRLMAAPQLQRARVARQPRGAGVAANSSGASSGSASGSAAGSSARSASDADDVDLLPTRADILLLAQTLVGTLPAGGLDEQTLPAYRDRIEAYAIKAAREAKLHTSWLQNDAEYESALLAFVRSLLARVRPNPALSELQSFVDRVAPFGAINSAAMAALKLTVPGVPDLYQGNELIDLSLVDPDNRRPVDYALRGQLLDDMERLAADMDPARMAALSATPADGRLKFWLTWRLLQWRRAHPDLFRNGRYAPQPVHGPRASHVIAFARDHGQERVIVLVSRFLAKLRGRREGLPTADDWEGTDVEVGAMDDGSALQDLLTGRLLLPQGGRVAAAELFAVLPFAVLVPTGQG
ncbi:MAG TPA: malto-oligosyltrehalose synthase, partial [Burkholderiaceae bacterium]|nr:malto-oligosyltrehalose synthase [Burkholderiaceae bacterium]